MSTIRYHWPWEFANSEEGLEFYTLTDSGFQKEPAIPTIPPSQSKICLWYNQTKFWNDIGVREEYMNALRSGWGVPLDFWRQVWTPDYAGFQNHYTLDDDGTSIKSIDIGFRWYASWVGYVFVLAHYNVSDSQMLLYIQEGHRHILPELFESHARLSLQPLESLGLILNTGCDSIMTKIVKCDEAVNCVELSLAASEDVEFLEASGYSKSDKSLTEHNKVLYSIQERVSSNRTGSDYIASICKQYLEFAGHLQSLYNYRIPVTNVQQVIRRINITETRFVYLDKMVQTQFSILANMITREDTKISISIAQTSKDIAEATRRDSSAMKAIAYLSLAFLPTTIISAIFSTTVLDFQNWSNSTEPRVVSGGWWVYALTCVLTTAVTLLVYLGWPRIRCLNSRRRVQDEEKAAAPDSGEASQEK